MQHLRGVLFIISDTQKFTILAVLILIHMSFINVFILLCVRSICVRQKIREDKHLLVDCK